ncbi:MAG: 6-phosphofructokinase [Candidatus Omnitrophica bacterium]|nr:6-phosphofructokinase [Candidatus Omnitrophota bacterium]
METIGILTGGGDCPGLNSVIRAVVRRAEKEGWRTLGFRYGWKGILENDFRALDRNSVSGILPKGGTILGTSRTNPYKDASKIRQDLEKIRSVFDENKLKALIVVGGEDTLGVASKLYRDGFKNIVGVPKTIDNDLSCTDYTFGFDTALNIATEAIDRLHTTAESHDRIMVVEIMGRHAGWIALEAGLAGGADVILIPEKPMDVDEICSIVKRRASRGRTFSIIAVAEGFKLLGEDVTQTKEPDAFGHVRLGGVGERLASVLEKKTGFETRCTVLGHLQRGGSPTAFDRVLGTRFGVNAVEYVKENKFGYMVSLRGNDIVPVKLEDAVKELKKVPDWYYEMAKLFFG